MRDPKSITREIDLQAKNLVHTCRKITLGQIIRAQYFEALASTVTVQDTHGALNNKNAGSIPNLILEFLRIVMLALDSR